METPLDVLSRAASLVQPDTKESKFSVFSVLSRMVLNLIVTADAFLPRGGIYRSCIRNVYTRGKFRTLCYDFTAFHFRYLIF